MSNMYDTTTVGSVANFPVSDITHRPKRKQGDMIRLKQAQEGIITEDSHKEETLEVVTLERAISHYKSMSADSVNGKLYQATAKWLEELLVTRNHKAKVSEITTAEEETVTDDN